MRTWRLFLPLAVLAMGCSRQDVDGLERIGRKILDRTRAAASPLREKLDHTVKGIGPAATVKERVQQRLQFDKALADTHIEVAVAEGEVELKGTLKTDGQRQRAIELAESTLGVERVADRLQVE